MRSTPLYAAVLLCAAVARGSDDAAAFEALSTSELRNILSDRGVNIDEEGLVDKADLISRVIASADATSGRAEKTGGSVSKKQTKVKSKRSRGNSAAHVVIKYCAS